jgi:hypothetical protein
VWGAAILYVSVCFVTCVQRGGGLHRPMRYGCCCCVEGLAFCIPSFRAITGALALHAKPQLKYVVPVLVLHCVAHDGSQYVCVVI